MIGKHATACLACLALLASVRAAGVEKTAWPDASPTLNAEPNAPPTLPSANPTQLPEVTVNADRETPPAPAEEVTSI
ncbi:MAG: hypothetical protein PHO89_10795, partial [Methylacidiphilaceae bacterium]|nr:hypothetical protein [Candidatus Methylacidiphilaceae bacterium]